ncbi:TetR/AcrR family transcriptional regulator [Acidipila sp. EB88]|uniref:TetR/AcrR family transcriptional regulator n=1 Tax=Acidipila sp. EB88 TaxID=2305226 RepID=UPI0013153371|nr:TetR/AcrR family transcriptional regulator [Acidipila sp. EB88]
MPSRPSTPTRRAPQQDRSARRVRAFLDASEALFAEVGFQATTMTAIAERAGSSIGALYSYFPDKKTLAVALLDIHASRIEQHWKPLFDQVTEISAAAFSEQFLARFLDFIQANPSYLQLQAAPVPLRRSAAAKRAFRATLVDALRRRVPSLTAESAHLRAGVLLQIVRGMMHLYADAAASERIPIQLEFQTLMTVYLEAVFAA